MASLYTKTKLYIEANSETWDDTKVSLQNDGSGDYIKTWTYSFTKPTDSQIASYETAGNAEESNNNVRVKRKEAYGNIGDQLDMLYKDMLADKSDKTGDWFKHIKDIKDANPKG